MCGTWDFKTTTFEHYVRGLKGNQSPRMCEIWDFENNNSGNNVCVDQKVDTHIRCVRPGAFKNAASPKYVRGLKYYGTNGMCETW